MDGSGSDWLIPVMLLPRHDVEDFESQLAQELLLLLLPFWNLSRPRLDIHRPAKSVG